MLLYQKIITMSNNIFFPIIGAICSDTEDLFKKKIQLLGSEEDSLVSYISTSGGEVNVTSRIISIISELKVKTIAYAGSIVYSSGSIIFSSFNKRFAFQDSKFLIHQCIPPKGTERTKIFEEYDRQIWQFMSERMEISLAKIEKIAKKGERMTSKQALDIGLVDEIIDSSWRDFKDLVIL